MLDEKSFSLEKQKLSENFAKMLHEDWIEVDSIRGPRSPEAHLAMIEEIKALEKIKGRKSYFHYLSTGRGSGPFVRLTDGSVKLDFISGIGIYFFGRQYTPFLEESVRAAFLETMQGNLQPNEDATSLLRSLVFHASKNSNLRHAWTFCSGTMANENALKVIRQKHFPATRIFAFEECFAGRSQAMAEVTDNPAYRQGLPTYGEVCYLPFYRTEWGEERSFQMITSHMEWELNRHPAKYAALMLELVQGEGGVRWAPPSFYRRLLHWVKAKGLAVWVDEVQTFGRTEQLFAFETFGVGDLVDVVTVGKLLQVCATLYTEAYNPKPGLIAGTFTGSGASFRIAHRSLEILTNEGFYGPEGKIKKMSDYFVRQLAHLKLESIKDIRACGGMIAFQYLDGSAAETEALIQKLFAQGLIVFSAGHGPYVVRMLPPMGVLTEKHVDLAIEIIAKTLKNKSP